MSVWVEIVKAVSCVFRLIVTLHVSVWVEILVATLQLLIYAVTLHVSVWVEMYYLPFLLAWYNVTLHVSVWVEIGIYISLSKNSKSRSTWACELKSSISIFTFLLPSHAPRERVSWNWNTQTVKDKQEVTLHVSVWVEIIFVYSAVKLPMSRSTWACELKCNTHCPIYYITGHAPRERVSWNLGYPP